MPSFGGKRKQGPSSPFRTDDFFAHHPVFSLETFRRVGVRHGLTTTALAERVKYGLERGRLKLLAKGLYAVVPPGVPADRFMPDRFLVASALAADAVLAYHSALELLGFAHSVYRDVYYLTTHRRKPLMLADGRVRALLPPKALRAKRAEDFGVEARQRLGVKLRVTGPESGPTPLRKFCAWSDLDFNYVGAVDREEMLREKPEVERAPALARRR